MLTTLLSCDSTSLPTTVPRRVFCGDSVVRRNIFIDEAYRRTTIGVTAKPANSCQATQVKWQHTRFARRHVFFVKQRWRIYYLAIARAYVSPSPSCILRKPRCSPTICCVYTLNQLLVHMISSRVLPVERPDTSNAAMDAYNMICKQSGIQQWTRIHFWAEFPYAIVVNTWFPSPWPWQSYNLTRAAVSSSFFVSLVCPP